VPGGSKDLTWFRADGAEMTGEDWHSAQTQTLGMCLDGRGLRQRGPYGEPVLDASYLLVLHAADTDTAFTLPGRPWAGGWEVLVDTARSDGVPVGGPAVLPPGRELPLLARSAALLRAAH
jgi:isoamylase